MKEVGSLLDELSLSEARLPIRALNEFIFLFDIYDLREYLLLNGLRRLSFNNEIHDAYYRRIISFRKEIIEYERDRNLLKTPLYIYEKTGCDLSRILVYLNDNIDKYFIPQDTSQLVQLNTRELEDGKIASHTKVYYISSYFIQRRLQNDDLKKAMERSIENQ